MNVHLLQQEKHSKSKLYLQEYVTRTSHGITLFLKAWQAGDIGFGEYYRVMRKSKSSRHTWGTQPEMLAWYTRRSGKLNRGENWKTGCKNLSFSALVESLGHCTGTPETYIMVPDLSNLGQISFFLPLSAPLDIPPLKMLSPQGWIIISIQF